MVAVGELLSNGTGKSMADPEGRSKHLRGSQMDRARVRNAGQRIEDRMKTTDNSRKWMWRFLGVIGAMQLYFVRELLAAFALFALGFGAIAVVIGALYMLHSGCAVAVE